MKCDNCPALRTDGYEYPESYCAAGVPEGGKKRTEYGCRYSAEIIRRRMYRLDREFIKFLIESRGRSDKG